MSSGGTTVLFLVLLKRILKLESKSAVFVVLTLKVTRTNAPETTQVFLEVVVELKNGGIMIK